MGKKKIGTMKLIENKASRNVTYCKRKRGLIKKAMELSLLCEQEIMVVIYDKSKKKLVMYNSTEEMTPEVVIDLLS